MRRSMFTALLSAAVFVAGPTGTALGTGPAAAQGHGGFHGGGGGGFRSGGFGGGAHIDGGYHGGYGGYRGGYRGGYYGGYRGGYYRGGYYGGFGYGFGCCGYYGGYYDGAGFLLGAAAVAGVTALAVDSAYDRTYYDPGYVVTPAPYYSAPIVPAGDFRLATFDKRDLIERCARAAESDASGWASTAKFVRMETFDRDGPNARVDGILSVSVGGRYDREGFPQGFPQDGGSRARDVRFTCALDGGQIVDLRVDRPNG